MSYPLSLRGYRDENGTKYYKSFFALYALSKKGKKKMHIPQKKTASVYEIKNFTYPKLHTGKDWYIDFYAFCPASGTMRRKKIKLNHISKIGERRKYAEGLIKRTILNLERGWNPWIEAENSRSYHYFKDVCDRYKQYIEKLVNDNLYREDTYISYMSYLRNIEKWNQEKNVPIRYIYQFDSFFVREFLDHIYIDRNNSATTRNNYLGFIKTFCTYLLQNQYININPSEGIQALSRRLSKKQRTIIAENDMIRLHDYLDTKNKYFLLASYVLHYCFIRPKEMSMIKISHLSVKKQTIYIPGDNSKNRKEGVVTLPAKVIRLMIDLNIFSHPSDHFLFSDKFMPGEKYRNEKQFRDFWTHFVRKDLKFPANYKFYSLKDTGITNMLRKYDTITVRDQARHADILMTDTYTPHDLQNANKLIMNHEGAF